MTTQQIVHEIDSEIARLQQAKAILSGLEGSSSPTGQSAKDPLKKRTMSAETKAKMAAAQSKRWAIRKG